MEVGFDAVEGITHEEDGATALEGGGAHSFGVVGFDELDHSLSNRHFSDEIYKSVCVWVIGLRIT